MTTKRDEVAVKLNIYKTSCDGCEKSRYIVDLSPLDSNPNRKSILFPLYCTNKIICRSKAFLKTYSKS